MTDAPIAQTIHPGNGVPAPWRQKLIAEWLTAHGVAAEDVSADDPITVLTLPYVQTDPDDSGPWFIQVIVFTEYYRNRDGFKEANLLTRKPVSCQRTVPLRHAFPTAPTTDGEDRGEEPQVQPVQEGKRPPQHQGGTETDEQQAIRLAEAEEVQDRRSPSCQERPGEGGATRIADPEEGRTPGRGGQVPEPEEDRQEEVEAGQ